MRPKKTPEQAMEDARVAGKKRALDVDYARQLEEFDELVGGWFRKYAPQIEEWLPSFEEQLKELATQWLIGHAAKGTVGLPSNWDELVSGNHELSQLFWRHVAIASCQPSEVWADGDVTRRGAPVSTLSAM